jgi:hypothetical protein
MAVMIRDKIRENAQQFLDPAEEVQAVFAAQTFNGWWAFLSWLIVLFKNSYRAVVVTDKRIAVFNTGRWAMGTPKNLLRDVPRSTKIGTPSGLWWKTEALGERMYIHKRFHKDVEAADALAPG